MQNVIYKIKSYFPQPVQGARHTTLLYFYENWTAVYCKDQNMHKDFFLARRTLYFLNDFQIHQKVFYRNSLPGREVREDSSPDRIQPVQLLQTKKLSMKKMLLNSSWYLIVSSITFILNNNPTLNNCFHFCKQINKLIN